MPKTEKQKRRIIAIARQLKEQKGFTFKHSEYVEDLARFKKAQSEILKIKEEYKGVDVIQKKADIEYKKFQAIIDQINDYMQILHPEGLLDFGSSEAISVAKG
jgi:hypothetical protein